jgi:hypothetical protein
MDAVSEPVELFDPVEAPAADAPRAFGRMARRGHSRHVADAPGPATDDDVVPADQRKNARSSVLGCAQARPIATDLRQRDPGRCGERGAGSCKGGRRGAGGGVVD